MVQQNHKVEEIDQLWYTWSDVGIDTIRAGLRIRAASPGLQDYLSERVQKLAFSYQRYILPHGADPATSLGFAPVSLAFLTAETGRGKEKVLIHKVYTGRDIVGRYGVFFAHLLAGLPDSFSPKDAIALWKSSLWQTSDKSLPHRTETSLNYESLHHLQEIEACMPDRKIKEKLKQHLPYVVQAYLTKKQPPDQHGSRHIAPEKLYIAGSDDTVAFLIQGLTSSLPLPLLNNLTFTTYEQNIEEAVPEIVGTCWLSTPDADSDPHVQQLLPESFYTEKLAVNCYTGRYNRLENNLLVHAYPLAPLFALDATRYFLNDPIGLSLKDYHELKDFQELKDRFASLLDIANDDQTITVERFLDLYKLLVIDGENPIKYALATASLKRLVEILSKPLHQKLLVALAMREPGWWEHVGKKAITTVYAQYGTNVDAAKDLSQIALLASNKIVDNVRGEVTSSVRSGVQDLKNEDNDLTMHVLLEIMQSAVPPAGQGDHQVWLTLLHELQKVRNIFSYMQRHWNIYAYLMQIWALLLPYPQDHTPLLAISWHEFGAFLELELPLTWTAVAITSVASRMLSKEQADELMQKHHGRIMHLLQQLAQETHGWQSAQTLFKALARGNYGKKMELLFALLGSPMGLNEEEITALDANAQLTPGEQVEFLVYAGPRYLPLKNTLSVRVLTLFKQFAQKADQREKCGILFKWLESPDIERWLALQAGGEQNLAAVLQYADLRPQESEQFFLRYGEKYVALYPASQTLLSLFARYVESGGPQRLPLLELWLKQRLDLETFESLLTTVHLTQSEQIQFLERFDQKYILFLPKSRTLFQYINTFLESLWTINLNEFRNTPARHVPSPKEHLLSALCTASQPNTSPLHNQMLLISSWGFVAAFVRDRRCFEQNSLEIIKSIGTLLHWKQRLLPYTYNSLMDLIATAYVEHCDLLLASISDLRQYLQQRDLLDLLNKVVARAREAMWEGRHSKTFLRTYTECAFTFKSQFADKGEQEYFLNAFWVPVLHYADEKALAALKNDVKKTLPEQAVDVLQHIKNSAVTGGEVTPRFKQLNLWYERTWALSCIQLALFLKNDSYIARVAQDHMTTLLCSSKPVPEKWWERINKALQSLNEKDNKRYINVQEQDTLLQQRKSSIRPSAQAPAPRRPFHPGEAIRFWIVRTRVQIALRGGHVGSIVRVAADVMPTLEKNKEKVPKSWWDPICATLDFFNACESAYEQPGQETNRALIHASNELDCLAEKGYPVPYLTFHEWIWKEALRNVQYDTEDLLKNWNPRSLRPLNQTGMGNAVAPQAAASASARSARKGLFWRNQ